MRDESFTPYRLGKQLRITFQCLENALQALFTLLGVGQRLGALEQVDQQAMQRIVSGFRQLAVGDEIAGRRFDVALQRGRRLITDRLAGGTWHAALYGLDRKSTRLNSSH